MAAGNNMVLDLITSCELCNPAMSSVFGIVDDVSIVRIKRLYRIYSAI